MNRYLVILCHSVLAGGLLWFFPLFHVVRNEHAETAKLQSDFNAATFAQTSWTGQLIPSLRQAPDAATVLSSLRDDPQSARKRFGRKVGVSRTSLFTLRGSGTIVTIDKNGVGVALHSEAKEPDIILQTGLLFGNTVRDSTELVSASAFADSRQFNEVSTELNRLVETRVISMLKDKAVVGRNIDFAGCVELSDADATRQLTITPLEVHIE